MKSPLKPFILTALVLLPALLSAQADRAATLEARLREIADDSLPAAGLMLELIGIYENEEQVFGLIRTAARFSRAQAAHPKRPDVIVKLLDGYAVAARHDDIIATGRQFVEKYPDHALGRTARDHLANSLERSGRLLPAADTRAESWRNGGGDREGVLALQLYARVGNAEATRNATALAAEMTAKLPADEVLTAVGMKGLEMAARAEQWADGLQIAKTVPRRNAPMSDAQKRAYSYRAGQFESRLGQHENAIQSYRKALAKGRDDIHRSLIDAMLSAKKDPGEIEREARTYLNTFPKRDDRYGPLARTAHAFAESGKTAQAMKLAQEIMTVDVHTRDMPRAVLQWCGESHAQAERALLAAISKKPKGEWKLRAVLALELYRDRMVDASKARRAAHAYLATTPANDEMSERIAEFLLNSAPDDGAFRKDLEAIEKSARTFPHVHGYAGRLWKRKPKDKARAKTWDRERKSFAGDPIAKLWQQTHENGGKAGQACEALLKQDAGKAHREWLMSRLAYVYRHHLGGGARRTSARRHQALCQAYPKDFSCAERWLESADHAEKEKQEQRLAAARHLLTFPPQTAHHDTWHRLIDTRDPGVIRKAIPWITRSAAVSPNPLSHSGRIGDILTETKLEKEALQWWRSRMDIDLDHGECVACAERVAARMKPDDAAPFLRKRFATANHQQGRYAARIASLALERRDLDAMEDVLEESRGRARKAPFQEWTIGEWTPRSWLETARKAEDWPVERKTRVYRIVRDLDYGRVSAEAGLALLRDAEKGLDRLLEAQRLIVRAGQHHESWKRIFPHAQAAMARNDFTLGSTVLNGLIHTVRSAGESEMDNARTMLRRAYGQMGSVSADIPPDSPIAPLLQIIVHLRLGEQDLAEQAYYRHRKLFDDHRNDLPVELILFGAETHIAQGTEEDLLRADDILAGWMMAFSESEKVDPRDKARVRLALARKYKRAQQFDAARLEFKSVLNNHAGQPEAVDARFGIGETFMAQKVFDEAEAIFAALSESSDPRVTIRAEFLRGVVAIRQGNNEDARNIFLEVLERVPDTDLADETLYNLAEVYGLEQRYLTQLETLRTVGRLGRESKLWHTPGNALSVVVQDTDLGISRGEARIPVVVRTDPGGDEEESYLASGGAGKGIFLTEIPTALGEASAKDGTLQVTGGDVITVDYPDDFKEEFQFEFLSSTRLRIASDGKLEVASSRILDEEGESFTEALKNEVEDAGDPASKAATRPRNQVKPGNLVYMQVRDGDRDLTAEPDKVPVKLTASSGDEVLAEVTEMDRHGGAFSGSIRTGELPAGAKATDSALDHSALMAIDHSLETAWRSEPDGAAPKSLSVDLKELRPVESVIFTSPQSENEAPVRMHVRGSHDGRFWYTLAGFPMQEAPPRIAVSGPEMRLRVYPFSAKKLRDKYMWKDFVELVKNEKPRENQKVETIKWDPPEEGEEAFILVWSGRFRQERDGGLRLAVSGLHTAAMIDGRLELPAAPGAQSGDIFARRGLHELVVIAVTKSGGAGAGAERARENPQAESISLRSFNAADFDLGDPDEYPLIDAPVQGEIVQDENSWTLTMPSHLLRFVDCRILEYRGEAVAFSNVEIAGEGQTHVPPAQDVLELAGNHILELAPGDTVTVSYLDELTAGARQRNRLLTGKLTATYFNGRITPISYDFARAGDGSVRGARKELLRIDPGNRIVAEVVDYDLDVSLEKDEVEVQVQVNGDSPVTLTATESGPSTGIFLAEIDTAAEPEEGKLAVKQGDKVYLRYQDEDNIFPGHAFHRETSVFLNEPTEGIVQIVESRIDAGGAVRLIPVEGGRIPDHMARVDYHQPLTVEVIDPDQARDTRSTVTVDVETTQGTRVQVECVLSRNFAPPGDVVDDLRNPALWEGRFVGQVPLLLGGIDNATSVPADGSVKKGGLGRIIAPPVDEEPALVDNGTESEGGLLVLNVNGKDRLSARYRDALRPDGQPADLHAKASLFTAATLRLTDGEYQEDAEIAYVGKKLFLWLDDADLDVSGERDRAMVRLVTATGEDETLELEETLSHSGTFSGSFPLKATQNPVRSNSKGEVECFFGDEITVGYLDNVPHTADGEPLIELAMPVAVGTDGLVGAFSKVYKDEDLAIQTQFHIAESYFELFKSHLRLERKEEAQADLAAGRRVLRELREDYPNPRYAPRVSYLLGQFAQEMKSWDEAIDAYRSIVRGHPEHELAPDAQYKLGQCYEEAGQLDEALESYVTLAATYPKSPLIANVMLRINEHFYKMEEFKVAASVGAKFLERFPNHEWTPRMAFRIGQCRYKEEEFKVAGDAFDEFVKRFPEEELTAQALFWAGESYRMARDIPNAFRRYNRCRWDFPESEAAKYSRGRLALPELLAQFEREANLTED